MNPDDIKRLFPFASQSTLRRNAADGAARGVVSNPKREPPPVDEPVATVPREAARQGRLRIVVTSYRVRLLDDDNVALGAKPLVDCCVAAGFIPSDAKIWCDIQHEQKLVMHPALERTEIVLENL